MPQAKVLNEKEIRRVLLHVATKKHAARNRAMFTVLNLTGMRVGELAALRLADVLTSEGDIREEVYLSAQMTKGSRGRTVVLSDKAQEEIKNYLQVRFKLKDLHKHVKHFGTLLGYKVQTIRPEDPVNIRRPSAWAVCTTP